MKWLSKISDGMFKVLPHLWGFLWIAIITVASLSVFLTVVNWLFRILGLR